MTKDTYFEKIYGSYYQSILNYMFCRVHNRAIAEELAADVFLLAYKNLDSYDHSKALSRHGSTRLRQTMSGIIRNARKNGSVFWWGMRSRSCRSRWIASRRRS